MMISFAIGFVIIFNDWQEYISFFSSKTLLVQASSYSSKTAAYLNVFDKLRRGSPIPISGEMGTLNNKLFDPLELASEENFAQYREAELKHGRVAMLATVGMTLPEMLSNIKLPVELPEFGNLYLSASKGIKFSDVPYGLKAISHVPWQGWFQIFVVIGILETQIFVQKNELDMPGDYNTGFFGLRDKTQNEEFLLNELELGRLAMIGFVLQVILELATGESIVTQWGSIFQ